LRNINKKLRSIEDLEKRVKAGEQLDPDQASKK
jgi:hypothetical protein